MSEGWDVRPLGELCTIKPPKAEARSKLRDVDPVSFVPMEDLGVGAKSLIPSRTRSLGEVSGSYTYFADGDVLLAKITPCFENGKLGVARGLVNGIGFGSSEFIVLRPGPELEAEFLYYYLARPSFLEDGARSMTGAVGHKRVAKEFIEAYPVPLPSRSEQRRIVAILDEAFEGIAIAKANAEKNLQSANELFSVYLQAAFAQLEGAVPIEKLGHVCEFEGGSQPPKSEFVYAPRSGYVRFLQIRDFGTDKHETYIPEAKKNRLCNERDIFIGRYGASVGKILTGKAGAYNVALMKTVPNLSVLDLDFFHRYLTSGAFQSRLMNVAARSAQDGFSKEDIFGFPVPLPPLAKQRAIVEEIDPVHDESQRLADIYGRKVAALEELKKSLLHQAFSGALTNCAVSEEVAELA
ncbi:MAG: restriction endonuclease subunit S [Burkholderiales bacterium]